MAVALAFGAAFAGPIDMNTAKSLGKKFVQTKFEQTRGADLELTYTVTSDRGEACVYVFNVGTTGFVLVSATDNVRPILGYSVNGNFDSSNPYNGAMYMLETYKNSISYAIEKNIAPTPEIAAEWETLRTYGRLSNQRGNSVEPLVWTRWNQDSPYNLYAPQVPANANPQHISQAPGGRCYAGCVATAMGQLMKYWDAPLQGEGSHSYNCIGYGPTYYNYGVQSANFGATTYQWDLMPRSLSNASQEQIEAVALLLYHCGVATDMTYDWDGSGTYSDIVPGAMNSYFDYDYCVKKNRSSFTLTNWINMLKAEFDLGRPVYYSGQSSSGGHAFVADGYDENDLIHFNFGWSGSDDDYYAVDAIDYASQAAAIFNFVPSHVYNNTAQAPSNLVATKTSDIAQSATITWTNPTKTMTNVNLSAIDQIVVTRDGKTIYTVDNPTPGADMNFVDETVPCYSTFEYRVYAMVDGVKGAAAVTSESFGPTCEWKAVVTASAMQGWKGGAVYVYDGAGREITNFTMTNNNPATINFNVTLGRVFFAWKEGSEPVTLSIKIKDANGNTVYEFAQGESTNIPSGYFYTGNNGCTSTMQCEYPGELFAEVVDGKVSLTWEGVSNPGYGYNIYRDGYLFELAQTNSYVDEDADQGGHCYQVCVLCDGGESEPSNEACGTTGEGCDPGYNLWYTLQTSGKPTITWERPENENLSGFIVYRREGDDGEWERAKVLGANKTEYKETKSLDEGIWYYYKVVAVYQSIDCTSAPFKAMYGNEYFVKIFFSTTGVNEFASSVSLYPNPTRDSFTIEGENLQQVMVYNALGQLVHHQECNGDNAVINLGKVETGIYMVKVVTANGESIQRVSVIK